MDMRGLFIGAAYWPLLLIHSVVRQCFLVRLAQREEAPAPVVFQAKNIATQWMNVCPCGVKYETLNLII